MGPGGDLFLCLKYIKYYYMQDKNKKLKQK